MQQLLAAYRDILRPQARLRLDTFLASEGNHRLVARQPLLAAMRTVLAATPGEEDSRDFPPALAAVLLSHAVATDLAPDREDEQPVVAGVPESLFIEILRIPLLYQADDVWSSIDRIVRLWRDYGPRIAAFPLRKSATELLEDATGLALEEIVGLGFGLFAHASNLEPGVPPLVTPDLGSDMAPEKLAAFRRLVTATYEKSRATAFRARPRRSTTSLCGASPSSTPAEGLLVLDIDYLWERVTSGLYWIVHDFEKSRGEWERQRWSQAFAEAIELLAEDELRAVAPQALGGGRTLYTEEDFQQAYGTAKRCDVAIDFGSDMLLAEIVSGQLSVPSRVEGDLDKFRSDTERLVVGKCRQLDAAAAAVLADASALTGFPAVAGLRVLPLLIVGGGYPVSPFTTAYVHEWLNTEGLLDDPRVDSLSIVDLGELEMLEGLADRGQTPVAVLRQWKESRLAEVSLRNFVVRTSGNVATLRASRMEPRVQETFQRLVEILSLRES